MTYFVIQFVLRRCTVCISLNKLSVCLSVCPDTDRLHPDTDRLHPDTDRLHPDTDRLHDHGREYHPPKSRYMLYTSGGGMLSF